MPKTTYEYDDAGRLVSSRTESEWDDDQRGWMLGLAEYRASRCPCGCGLPARETTSRDDTGPTFTVPDPVRCRARDALLMKQDAYNKAKVPRADALLWTVQKGGTRQ